MGATRIAIVGAGPWGTYAVERLAAQFSADPPSEPVEIFVFERSGRFGAGSTHDDRQVRTSYLNRVASQLSFAADESNATDVLLPRSLRPSLVEWAQEHFRTSGDARFALHAQDVPHRYLHGYALRDMFNRFVEILRAIPLVRVHTCATEVTNIRRADANAPLLIIGEGAAPLAADHVLLVTGHADIGPATGSTEHALARHADEHGEPTRYVSNPYPLAQRLDEVTVPADRRVGVLGLGLTAVDLVLHLTEGRGGLFSEDERGAREGRLRYLPSGREPRSIVAVSPSGVFISTRPRNDKAADASGVRHVNLEHRAVFLTRAAIRQLRSAHGTPVRLPGGERSQIDFGRHVFPLVTLEMAFVYYRTLFGGGFAEHLKSAVDDRYRAFLSTAGDEPEDAVDRLLEPVDHLFDRTVAKADPAAMRSFFRVVYDQEEPGLVPRWGHSPHVEDHRFVWRYFFEPQESSVRASDSWQEVTAHLLRADIAAAQQGNLRNPYKAACDGVWRDLRGEFSEAMDFGGLTAGSHREVLTHYLRLYARMSNGTGLEPMRKILALVEAGVLDMSVGPRPLVEPVAGRPGFRLRGPLTRADREVDILVRGRVPAFDAEHDSCPLYRNMIRAGLVRRWRNPGTGGAPDFEPGGLDVTADFHPRQADGTVDQRLTVLGAPVEGVAFFQLSAARPHSGSGVLDNIARWASAVVDQIRPRPATSDSESPSESLSPGGP